MECQSWWASGTVGPRRTVVLHEQRIGDEDIVADLVGKIVGVKPCQLTMSLVSIDRFEANKVGHPLLGGLHH